MDGLNVDQVVEVPDTPDRLTSQNINVIDCNSDISDGEWRNKNKQATRTDSRRMFNIQKIASRTTPPNKSAFYPKGNVVVNTPNRTLACKLDVVGPANKEACVRSKESSGWISTRKRTRKLNPSLSDEEHVCRKKDDPRNVTKRPRNLVVRRDNEDGSNARNNSVSSQNFSVPPISLVLSQKRRGCLLNEKPGTSHRTQKFDSQQDDSGTSRELTVKENDSRRLKGKGILSEEEFDEKRKPLCGRTLACKLDVVGPANKEACVRSKESSGWISTRKRTRRLIPSLSDEEHVCHKEDDPRNVTKRPRNLVVRRDNEDGSNARNNSVSSQNLSVPPISLVLSQQRRGCLLNEKPRTSHRTQKFDSQQDDSGTSRELTVKENDSRRLKGKGILSEEEFDGKRKPLCGRTLAGNLDGVGPANKEACIRSEESSGWISTRKRTRKLDPSLSDEEHLFHKEDDPLNVTELPRNVVVRRDNEDGSNARNKWVSSQNLSVAPISLTLSQKHPGCLLNEHHGSSNTAIKRRKKSSGTHHWGSSSSPSGNSEVLAFGSSGEPSNLRSVRTQNSHTASSFSRIIDIGDFSPERSNGSHNRDCSRNSESDVRVIQVEEDEILALELQEQLYLESNVAADREIDEQIALERQQGSFQHTFPSGSHHESHPTSSFMSNLNRQNLSESSQSSSTHRVTQDRVPTATRMPQLRRLFPTEPRAISSRQRNSLYPPSTDFDMRMHVLGALESVNNIGVASSLLQIQRDFNENDYEMLLALDENNHQHCGASEAQINGLPESTVQTDNLEACSVCLETPSIGDAMRHLPCLHKFHKDCIDEWLRRRASCPICKSFI